MRMMWKIFELLAWSFLQVFFLFLMEKLYTQDVKYEEKRKFALYVCTRYPNEIRTYIFMRLILHKHTAPLPHVHACPLYSMKKNYETAVVCLTLNPPPPSACLNIPFF